MQSGLLERSIMAALQAVVEQQTTVELKTDRVRAGIDNGQIDIGGFAGSQQAGGLRIAGQIFLRLEFTRAHLAAEAIFQAQLQ